MNICLQEETSSLVSFSVVFFFPEGEGRSSDACTQAQVVIVPILKAHLAAFRAQVLLGDIVCNCCKKNKSSVITVVPP